MINKELGYMDLSSDTTQAVLTGDLDLFDALLTGEGLKEGETRIIWKEVMEASYETGMSPDDDLESLLVIVKENMIK